MFRYARCAGCYLSVLLPLFYMTGKRWKMSEEGKRNVAKSKIGRVVSRKARSSMRMAALGKPKSKEQKRKMSEYMQGRQITRGMHWKWGRNIEKARRNVSRGMIRYWKHRRKG